MGFGINASGPRHSGIFDPSVKSSPKVDESGNIKKAFAIEESQSVNKNVNAPPAVDSAGKVSALKPVTKADGTPSPSPRENIARPISRADIVDELVHIQKAPTTDNIQIMSTILQFGLEASASNFETVQTLVKGRKSTNSLESSVASLSKGLAETPRSVDIIGHFLNNQLQINQQLQQLQSAMSQFQLSMNFASTFLDSGLLAGLGAAVSELDDALKKLSKDPNERMDWSELSRGGLIKDFKALYEFIGGLRQKMSQEGMTSALERFLKSSTALQGGISGFLESLTSQAIMSEQVAQQVGNDRFGYWQFPNPWMQGQAVMELLVRKDPLKKKTEYNTQKTRIIVKFETKDLGEMTVILDVLDKKLWMTVSSDRSDSRQLVTQWIGEFKDQISTHGYELVGLKTTENKIDIKQLLLPKLNLDTLSRINTEV